MSKLKSTSYSKTKGKTRVSVPYDVDIYKKSGDFDNEPAASNVDLPSIGNYVTPRDKSEITPTRGSFKVSSEEQTFTMEKHESEFFSAIRALWKQGKMCDVILSVEKTAFRVHKIALAACSEHFRELFVNREKSSVASDLSRIPLLGIKSDVVKKIIDAIYSAKITLNSASVGDVLSAAAYLRMPSVVEACQVYLSKRLNVDNCLRTLQIAHLYNLENLKEKSYALACSNFKVISRQKEFSKLRYYELLSMLPRQDLAVDSEMQIFNAIIRWTEAERSVRLPYVGRLMRHVRFPLMTESQLVDHVEGSSIATEVPEVSELVREAVRYHLLPHRRSILQNSRTVPRTTFEAKVVIASGGLPGKEDGSSIGSIFYYDTNDNAWSPLAEMPEPRHHHAAVVLGGFLYIAGGDQGQGLMESSSKVWRYDSWTEEWIQVASMLNARQSFQLGILDSRIYAVGGRSGKDKTLSTVERYNPSTNTWSPVEPISSPRRYVALATLSGRLYAVGGSSSDLISRRVERFNPVSSQWERRHPLCKPRFSAFLHAAKNRLWLIGGATVHDKDPAKGVVATSEIEVYSPALDQWTSISKSRLTSEISVIGKGGEGENSSEKFVQTCRTEAGSCILDDNIYLVAGYDWEQKDRLSDVERINLSNLTPYFPKYSTVNILEHGVSGFPGGSSKNNEEYRVFAKPANYPLRCTGAACAVLTLHKKPKFRPRGSEMMVTLPAIQNPQCASEDKREADPGPAKNVPKLAFGEVPKTAAGRLQFGIDERTSSPREKSIEKGLDFLRSMGFPRDQIPRISLSKRVCTASRRTVSPRPREGDRIYSVSPEEMRCDLEDVTLYEGSPLDPPPEQDVVDVALDKVISLTMDDWDDQSDRYSTPATEVGETRLESQASDAANQTKVFMTE